MRYSESDGCADQRTYGCTHRSADSRTDGCPECDADRRTYRIADERTYG